MLLRCVLMLPWCMRACVCVCLCVCFTSFVIPLSYFSPPFPGGRMEFQKKEGKGEIDFWKNHQRNQNNSRSKYESLGVRVRFFHLNLLTFSCYCTDTAVVFWFRKFFWKLTAQRDFWALLRNYEPPSFLS